MAGKNQPPEEWVQLMREARQEARDEALAAKTKFPKLFIVVMVIGFILVGFLAWLKGQVDQVAASPLPVENKEVVQEEEDVIPKVSTMPVEPPIKEAPHRALPPASGGLRLPGDHPIHFDPPAKSAEGNED
ncbi:hypothetical protein JIN85_14220 [Luteolibacter pohnpeiensis]|uniref:Uncharacterized protein n=1 Tax=Luteolibacter pohnpeiensis TaxID=454153 RepID=A0A934S913_9BACT|nr:hypothetical protein [Luteolibacter pohnpeiensis]MBK1883575.1 hypothetical protein [Luteolibacter pohnpeiensis]